MELNSHTVRIHTHADEFRRCLIDFDIEGIKKLWASIYPSMPQPETEDDAIVCIHMARTAVERLPFRYRAYSHDWLTERGLPSQLPDELKDKAMRMYPRVVSAVGICVATFNNKKTDYHLYVTGKLREVVENYYADGIEDPVIIKKAMDELHNKLRKQK